MKTSLLALTMLWAGMALAQAPAAPDAQAPGHGIDSRRETPQQRMDHLALLLDLTDAQKAQVQTILDAEHAKVRQQHEQAEAAGQKPTREQVQAARELAQQETLAKLTPVLSAEQLKKFEVLMAHRHPPGGPG